MKRKLPNVVILTFLTTITVIVWIGYSIYDAYRKAPDIEIDPQVLVNINPSVNSDILAKLDEKVYFERGDTSPFNLNVTIDTSAVVEELPLENTGEENATDSGVTNN